MSLASFGCERQNRLSRTSALRGSTANCLRFRSVRDWIDCNRSMTPKGTIVELFLGRKASALIPVVMSLTALMLVLVQVWIHGLSPEPDEGAVAHLYQLLVLGQMPVIACFGIRWLRQAPLQGLRVLVAQGFALAAALVPVHMMGW